jgi:very-short-patch-repair endonuclease
MRIELPDACSGLVGRQSGVIGREQALRAGLRRDVIDGLVRTGRWQRMQSGVYATFSGEPNRDARLWAIVLRAGPGAVLSHRTAAALYGLIPDPGDPVHLILPRARNPRRIPGVVVHRLDRAAVVRHPALLPPRTRVEETVLDLVTTAITSDEAFGWVFRATGQQLTTAGRLRAAAAARPTMRWRLPLSQCLNDMADGVRSNLEHRYVLSVERPHGLPTAERQVRIVRDGRARYLDNLYRPQLVCVELDGRAAHPPGERWRDYRRDNIGATDGIITLRYGWSDVTGQPCRVAAQVAAVLTQRGWTGRPRRCGAACAVRP